MENQEVWLTEEQKMIARGMDPNEWNPVVIPSDFRKATQNKELWPKFKVRPGFLSDKLPDLIDKMQKGVPQAFWDGAREVLIGSENHRDINTGELIEYQEENGFATLEYVKKLPIRWISELVKGSLNGGTTDEELEGVKS